MACRINRDASDNILEVLTDEGRPSQLYADIVTDLKTTDNKRLAALKDPFIASRIAEGTIRNTTAEEVAFGVYAKTATAAFQSNLKDNIYRDINGEIAVTDPAIQKLYTIPTSTTNENSMDRVNQQTANILTASFAKAGIKVHVKMNSNLADAAQLMPQSRDGSFIIQVNPNKLPGDAIFHEFGHIYIDLLGLDHPVIQKAVEALRYTELWMFVENEYPNLTYEQLQKEVVASAIGFEGKRIIEIEENSSTIERIIREVLDAIGALFSISFTGKNFRNIARKLAKELYTGNVRTDIKAISEVDYIQRRKQYNELDSLVQNTEIALKENINSLRAKGMETKAEILDDNLKKLRKAKTKANKIRQLIKYAQVVTAQTQSMLNTMNQLETFHEANDPNIAKYSKNIANIYQYIHSHEHLEDIQDFLNQEELTPDEAKLLQTHNIPQLVQDLRDASSKFREIERKYNYIAPYILADQLLDYHNQDIDAELKKHLDVMAQNKADGRFFTIQLDKKDPDYTTLQSQLDEGILNQESFEDKVMQLNIEQLKNKFTVGRAQLVETLRKSIRDKSGISMWLDPFIHSTDVSFQLFAKKVKHAFDRADVVSTHTRNFLGNELGAYLKSTGQSSFHPAKLNKPFIEVIDMLQYDPNTGLYTMKKHKAFVQEYDVSKYYESKKKFIDDLYERLEYPTKGTEKDIANWMDTHLKQVNQEIKKWDSENTIPIEGADQTIKDKLAELNRAYKLRKEAENSGRADLAAAAEHEEKRVKMWLNKNTRYANGKYTAIGLLARPSDKYKNSKYAKIQADPAKKRYYNALRKVHVASQDKIGEYKLRRKRNAWDNHSYILPSTRKQKRDMLFENGMLKVVKEASQSLNVQKGDDIYNSSIVHTEDETKKIPIYYTEDMAPEDVSVDLANSLLSFDHMANLFQSKSEIQDTVLMMEAQIANREQVSTAPDGQPLMKRLAKTLGYNVHSTKKAADNNNLKALRNFIDMNFYGEQNVKSQVVVPLLNKQIEMNKVSRALISFTAMNALSFNLLQATNQVVLDDLMNYGEAMGGKYYTRKQYFAAKKEYTRYGMSMKDLAAGRAVTKLGAAIEMFDPLQGEMQQKLTGRSLGSKGKRMMTTDFTTFLQHGAEHEVAVTRMIARLMNIKPKNANGKYINRQGKETDIESQAASLWNMIQEGDVRQENGNLVLKNGITVTDMEINNIKNQLHGLTKLLNGVYNQFDKAELKRHWWGKPFLLFRSWMMPGVRKRYGREAGLGMHIDEELGVLGEGSYVSFTRALRNVIMSAKRGDYSEAMKILAGKSDTLTDMEKLNISRTLNEVIGIAVTMILFAGLMSMIDDDEEDIGYGMNFTLYQAKRLQTELRAFVPLPMLGMTEFLRLLESPTATYSSLDKFDGFLKELLTLGGDMLDGELNEGRRYKRRVGSYEKGTLKLKKKFFDLIPILRGIEKSGSPEEALKWFLL